MNLVILQSSQFLADGTAITNARQTQHLRNVLKAKQGDKFQIGELNGLIGTATIVASNHDHFVLGELDLTTPPPSQLPLTIILGMPRPQMLKRILQTVATMGVQHLAFIQTSRVEKSFWQSPSVTPEAIEAQLILGLEQGVVTQLPHISMHRRFRPFIEDELDQLTQNTNKFIADPIGATAPTPHHTDQPVSLAIGPEGGFLTQEVERFVERGFSCIHLGKRILKVETAVPVLIAKLFHF